jgi:hypothetical protein
MPARPRKQIVDESEPGLYHCFSRCVRRAFLCGQDDYANKNYDHRKGWIEERLSFLAGQMAFDVTGHAILDNHLHVVLRTRPDIVEKWSNKEVARRWLALCPGKRKIQPGGPQELPTSKEINALVANMQKIAERRKRLSSLSWFMKFLKEHVAREANSEDETSGAFWEGRFCSTRLLDEFAILLCTMYVDLNAIRAGTATMPETSFRTSVYLRIRALLAKNQSKTAQDSAGEDDTLAAAWLAPVDEASPPPDGLQAQLGRRASDKGFLPMPLEKYIQLLDWSGREIRSDKRGSIPTELAPIFERLGLPVEYWMEGLVSFRQWFGDFAGRPSTLREFAAKKGLSRLRGMR